MNDQGYIRKAVELADGFDYYEQSRQIVLTYGPSEYDFISTFTEDLDRWFLDALAAQLVRQVDAIDSISLDNKGGEFPEIIVWNFRPGKNRMAASQRGPDRTMNTIKAIVDSGVLSEEAALHHGHKEQALR